jgi:hypothetical protein
VHRQRAYVGGGLQPGAACLVVVCLAVVTPSPLYRTNGGWLSFSWMQCRE